MNDKTDVRVTAAIITQNRKVFIAKRPFVGRMPGLWEFPGGKIEDGETPEQCLKRELHEELDIEVAVGAYLGSNTHRYDFGTVELMAYRTTIIAGEMKLNAHAEVAWATSEDLCRYAFAPADIPFVDQMRSGNIEL